MTDENPILELDPVTQYVTVNDETPTLSVIWDKAVQGAVVAESPGPTIASRAYAMTHTAIYDAWSCYDPVAVATTLGDALQQDDAESTEANKAAAMSWAAYTVLSELFPDQRPAFDAVMGELGLATDADALPPGGPEALGREMGAALLAARADDGANQAGGYADTTGYEPVNTGPFDIAEIDRWTPENVPIDPEEPNPDQSFLTPHWGTVAPFGLASGDALRPPAPEPFFQPGVEASLDIDARTVTLAGGEVLALTPALVGTVINPAFIAQAEQVAAFSAALTDEQKLIAEFWEDGGGTSFPPGSWMTFGQYVSARDDHGLDDDARMFLALGNAVMDAGIATWESKVHYDYVRPVRAIRELGALGLIGEEGTDALTGEPGHVIDAWAGPGLGTQTVLAENFITYQTPGSDVSPPFAEYTSGHSAFSAAGAAVLGLFSGSDAFGGAVTFEAGTSRFEPEVTPAEAVTLHWETFTDAADEAGISRLYGGIHFEDGDLDGRALGRAAGEAAFRKAMTYITGHDGEAPPPVEPEVADAVTVGRLFEAAFGRVARYEGLNFWEEIAGERLDDVALAEVFLGCPEFLWLSGEAQDLAPEALVDTFFLNLGIDAEATDLDETLVAGIEDGGSRAEALAALVVSEEAALATGYLAALDTLDDGSIWFA